jgi:Flp pilus assembly protein TadD
MAELGAAYVRAGLPELAEGWYVRAMKVSTPDADVLLALAGVYESLGRQDRRGETFRAYLEIHPEDRKARRQLVRILLELDAFADAAEQIAKLLPLEPNNVKLKSTLAVCYRRTGKYPEALVLLKDLLSESPASQELIKAAVFCLDKMGARAVGVRALESFMKQHGESLSLILMLGVLHFQADSLSKAAETFRKALSLSPKDWRANRNLGMVYKKMGNDIFADKFLAKASQYRAAVETTASEAP